MTELFERLLASSQSCVLLFQSFDLWVLAISLLLVSSCAMTSRLPTGSGSPSNDGAARRIAVGDQTLKIVGSFAERPLVAEPPNPPPVSEVVRKRKVEALPNGQAKKKKKGKERHRYPPSGDPTYVWVNGEVDSFVSRCTSS